MRRRLWVGKCNGEIDRCRHTAKTPAHCSSPWHVGLRPHSTTPTPTRPTRLYILTSDTRDFLARMSVSMSWNAASTAHVRLGEFLHRHSNYRKESSPIDMHTHACSAFDNGVTLTFDFLTSGSTHVKRLPCSACMSTKFGRNLCQVRWSLIAFRPRIDRQTDRLTHTHTPITLPTHRLSYRRHMVN